MDAPARNATARLTAPLMLSAALFTAAGGYIHLREWLDTYRHVPAGVPGSAVVRIGFPINVAVSFVLAAALLATTYRLHRLASLAVGATILFEAASLASLIISRTGSLFGWTEPVWTNGADQTRAVEIGALLCLAAVSVIAATNQTKAVLVTAKEGTT
jgi:hypothetical protein